MGKELCPICASRHARPSLTLYDDRYGYPGEFPLRECASCGHIWTDAEFSAEALVELYTGYYPRSSYDVEKYAPFPRLGGVREYLGRAKSCAYRWVPGGSTVLDIGCGSAESLGYLREKGCEVYGVEADENVRSIAQRHGFRIHFGLFDPSLYEEGFFDYVTLDQVIEHVFDPFATVEGIRRILKRGGTVVLSTPNARGFAARFWKERWMNWHIPYHLHFYSPDSMRILAQKCGLTLHRRVSITSSEWIYSQMLHALSRPPKGELSPLWSGAQRPAQKTLLTKAVQGLHRLKAAHPLSYLLDLAGAGDNDIYLLRK